MTNFTTSQLEAWAGLSAKAIIASLAGIETPQMKGDNLAVTLCSCFENPNQEQGEDGWTPDAIKGYDEVMAAIREHLAPLAAAPNLARLVLEKDAEIAALQAFKNYVHERLDKAGIPTHPDGEHSKAGCRIGDRLDIALAACQAMKETSDE